MEEKKKDTQEVELKRELKKARGQLKQYETKIKSIEEEQKNQVNFPTFCIDDLILAGSVNILSDCYECGQLFVSFRCERRASIKLLNISKCSIDRS